MVFWKRRDLEYREKGLGSTRVEAGWGARRDSIGRVRIIGGMGICYSTALGGIVERKGGREDKRREGRRSRSLLS